MHWQPWCLWRILRHILSPVEALVCGVAPDCTPLITLSWACYPFGCARLLIAPAQAPFLPLIYARARLCALTPAIVPRPVLGFVLTLQLRGNELTSVPNALADLLRLTWLDLS